MWLLLEQNRLSTDKNIQDIEKLINSIKIDREAMENVQENQGQLM